MKVRLLTAGDEDLLRAAAVALDSGDPGQERARFLLGDPSFVLVVAQDSDGAVMGRVYGHVLHRFTQTDLLLNEVDVVPQHMRRGAGRAMLERLKDLCRERDYREMWVLTEEDNAAANALYTSVGGRVENSPARMFVFPNPR